MTVQRNRRYEPRIPCITPVQILGSRVAEARATNLSPGGLYLQCLDARELAPGDLLSLSIRLDDGGTPIRAVGRVVKAGDEVFFSGASVRFLVMAPEDLARLERSQALAHVRGTPIARVPLRPQRAPRRRLRMERLKAARWMPDLRPPAPVIHLGPA